MKDVKDDIQPFESLEDRIDLLDALRSLAEVEEKGSISLEDLKRDLEL